MNPDEHINKMIDLFRTMNKNYYAKELEEIKNEYNSIINSSSS